MFFWSILVLSLLVGLALAYLVSWGLSEHWIQQYAIPDVKPYITISHRERIVGAIAFRTVCCTILSVAISCGSGMLIHWATFSEPQQPRIETVVFENVTNMKSKATINKIAIMSDGEWIDWHCHNPKKFYDALPMQRMRREGVDLVANIRNGDVVSLYVKE
jgi:hypothetical protein